MKRLEPNAPEMQSADIVADNIHHLKTLFPEAFAAERKIDFDVLKQLLGGEVDDREERYGLNWHGKRKARQLALTPSTGTLRPCPEESVAWDTTQNIFIEGDNLEVLKLLQKSYAGKVKLIYIDPPYNTGKDFVYPDNFQDSIKNYLEITGQVEGGQKVSTNTEASGRFHTDWLNMMYPRLKLAHSLLREDGVIFVSIDDGELANLVAIRENVFGEENFVATVIWQKKYAKQNDSKTLSVSHDYVVLFAKNIQSWVPGQLERDEGQLSGYKNLDNDPRGRWQSVVYTCNKSKTERPNLYYHIRNPITGGDCLPDESRVWAYDAKRTERNIQEDRLWWGHKGELDKPRLKSFLSEVGTGIVPDTLWLREDVGDTQESAREISAVFGEPVFDTPKPTRLIERCVSVAGCTGSDLIVDFVSGSGTSGDAVYRLNAVCGGSLRFLLVQLPETLDKENRDQAVAARFCESIRRPATVAELTKERLRRCGRVAGGKLPTGPGDLGFRVFKLDSGNIEPWDPATKDVPSAIAKAVDNIKADRSDDDLVFDVLLKTGLDLCVPIESKKIAGKEVKSIGGGVLFTCFAAKIKTADAEPLALGIVKWRDELAPANPKECRVVFRDSAFESDVAKSNLAAILKQHGFDEKLIARL